MKPNSFSALLLFAVISLISFPAPGAATVSPAEVRSVPDGNYLVTLELNGKPHRLNLKVQGNKARCVKSSDPAFANVEGFFQLHHPAAFLARFRNGIDSQLWILRPDGSFAIREVPDRGEQQSAVPVKNDSIEAAK